MLHVHGKKVVLAVTIATVLFGVITTIVGTRTLLGSDPGYVISTPLLRFNAIMGIVYIAVGIIAWRRLTLGVYGAVAICTLNACVLGAIRYLYTPNGSIAMESLQAMTFRTVVWFMVFLVLAWVRYGSTART